MTLTTLEQQITDEYGKITGFVMRHVYLSVEIALAVGIVIGKVV